MRPALAEVHERWDKVLDQLLQGPFETEEAIYRWERAIFMASVGRRNEGHIRMFLDPEFNNFYMPYLLKPRTTRPDGTPRAVGNVERDRVLGIEVRARIYRALLGLMASSTEDLSRMAREDNPGPGAARAGMPAPDFSPRVV